MLVWKNMHGPWFGGRWAGNIAWNVLCPCSAQVLLWMEPICGGSEKLLVHPQSPLPLRDSCGWLRVQIQEVWSAVCEFTCVWVPF